MSIFRVNCKASMKPPSFFMYGSLSVVGGNEGEHVVQ